MYDENIRPIDNIEFGVWSNDSIKDNSALDKNSLGVELPELYDNSEPKFGGLIDTRLGVSLLNINCATCGFDSENCIGHFGHIDLAEPVYHDGYILWIKKILGCICLKCSKILIKKNEDSLLNIANSKMSKQRLSDVKKITKLITHCSHPNYGCGTPVAKIKIEKKKSTGTKQIVTELVVASTEDTQDQKPGGKAATKVIKTVLTPEWCYDILKNISDSDLILMGIDPKKTRPEDFIHKVYPFPPVAIRPSAKVDFLDSQSKEDDITVKMHDIVKANNRVRKTKESDTDKYGADAIQLLSYHIHTNFDNETAGVLKSEQKSKSTKSISARLKGKEGRVRGNLMGKRVDFSARSVITPDPSLSMYELRIPLKMAMNLTWPEVVTPYNIEHLTNLVKRGINQYPGANFVIPADPEMSPIWLMYTNEKIKLQYGDKVERHLVDNDIVLFNRQPTLHKLSMMAHKIKVVEINKLYSFSFALCDTTPYNADFDGDEMNIHVPQSEGTAIELEEIALIDKQIISPKDSVPIIGIVQDGLLGAYNMTDSNMQIDRKSAMNMITYTNCDNFELFMDKKAKTIAGTELYSLIIPNKVNVNSGGVEIKNGNIIKGKMNKAMLASKKANSLIHLIYNEYAHVETRHFLDNSQKIVNAFNAWNGFTVGIKDTFVDKDIEDQINVIVETNLLEVKCLITEMENNYDLVDVGIFEQSILAKLAAVAPNATKIVKNRLSADNNFLIMNLSGAKGSDENMQQTSALIGQQMIEAKRVQKKNNNRSLAYFHQNDDSALARGFVNSTFTKGNHLAQFIYHNMGSREGLIDTAVKSVTGDTPIIVMENGVTKRVLIGDWIDSQLSLTPEKVKHYTERELELLDLENEVYIPTCDADGKVTWGNITAITRHDPGKELYEIKTLGGRSVIVTESKSLLIWNKDVKKFLHTSTPDVVVGDYMPVTMELEEPPIITTYVNINNEKFDLNNKNGKMIGKYLMTNIGDDVMIKLCGDYNNKFVLNEAFTAPNEFVVGLLSGYFSYSEINNKSIKIIEDSQEIITSINMLLSRLGIFGKIKNNVLSIKGQWAKLFAEKITLTDNIKNDKLKQLNPTLKHKNFTEQNNVVLDKIIEINKVDVAKYPKVYDLTIPSTLNFGLANGLHVVDTAESGYIQRKLIKLLEDVCVKYDNTVRNSNNVMIQFIYGNNANDTTKQSSYESKFLEMSNNEILEKIKIGNKKLDDLMMKRIIKMRNKIRRAKLVTSINNITFDPSFMLNANIKNIINNVKEDKDIKDNEALTPEYVIDKLEEICDNKHTMVTCMANKSNFKRKDEKLSKLTFRFALYESLSPRICEIHDIKKNKFDLICKLIVKQFNGSMVEAGEMVGVVAAQSIGEPVTQLTISSFHHAGIASAASLGVPRFRELISLTTNLKTPEIRIIFSEGFNKNLPMANKIASHLSLVTMKDIRKKIDIYYDPKPLSKDGHMAKDHVYNAFYSHSKSKYACQKDISGTDLLLRIEINREKMMERDITLLDIKTKFCNNWEKRYNDIKTLKKDEKVLLEKITSVCILSNSDNDISPVIHIRFNMTDIDFTVLASFIDIFVDNFKLKGIKGIDKIVSVLEEPVITFDKVDGSMNKEKHSVIYTSGVNMKELRYIKNIDLNKTLCNDIMQIYELYDIDACYAALMREFKKVFAGAGSTVNSTHIKLLCDLMTNSGAPTSIDRHAMKSSDIDPLSRASFEKTVEHLLTASVFGEIDTMRSVSSRIMAGLVIKGGTGMCDVLLDTELLENSEYTEDLEQNYKKTYNEVSESTIIDDTINKDNDDIFIPF